MPNVIWTDEATADRDDILDYISQFDRAAAERMDVRMAEIAAKLSVFPMLGREGLVAGTREFILHPNYRLVYEIMDDQIWILTVTHVARQWPPVAPD